MTATTPGICNHCGQPIYVGDRISSDTISGVPVAHHLYCGPERSPQDSIQEAISEGYKHNKNPPPCLLTTEGLERMMAMVRMSYPSSEAQALALLSIAHSLVKVNELLSSLTDGDHPNNALRVVRYEG